MAAIKCSCGERMRCTDSRLSGADVRRRYACKCGNRATTKETVVEMDNGPQAVGAPNRPHSALTIVKGVKSMKTIDAALAAATQTEKP